MTLKLALRNLFRNSRRTALNLMIMAGGYSAVVIFHGFAANILDATRWGAVESQYGHVQIGNQKLWDRDSEDSFLERQLRDPAELKKKIASIEGVRSVSQRQSFYGLVSTGDRSVAAQIVGYEPEIEKEILNETTIIEGESFLKHTGAENRMIAAVGEGLAKSIGAKPGQTLTLIGQTADGGINAIDTEVISVFRTVIQEIDDTTVFIPIETAQKLLDTSTAERVVIKLKAHEMVDTAIGPIRAVLGEGERARVWKELARLYNQTEAFFDSQNKVVAAIIFSLIFLSTMSAVSMAVAERTGEIGTLRAIGRRREDVLRLFVMEGGILGFLGSIVGVVLAMVAMALINRASIPIVLPGASEPIPIKILYVESAFFTALFATVLAAVCASYFATRRALKMKIVDCLKYNI